ncbi:low-density lipoprotein receptor 1-like [Parasteatoda tepidariorum]|uniref:low-density lipoprotein receptor 1-like n=1 Tax=Parasteatoda tepidariorum TaxID=114398 RepID=UPI001C71D0A2|nr:low-density lipoprotein receptor 1-like [Parasteatoda tepidariorum]
MALRIIIALLILVVVSSTQACPFGFQCDDGYYCFDKRRVCDGVKDCKDNSDERDCHAIVCDPETEFRCRSGQCIRKSDVCDSFLECRDGSDESNCTESACRGFFCGDGVCLRSSKRCDNKEDCVDGSDEEGCIPFCSEKYKFLCEFGCIHRHLLCDGRQHCRDFSDEKDCGK